MRTRTLSSHDLGSSSLASRGFRGKGSVAYQCGLLKQPRPQTHKSGVEGRVVAFIVVVGIGGAAELLRKRAVVRQVSTLPRLGEHRSSQRRALLPQKKKSKSRKMNRKMSKTAKTRKKIPRSIALGISEPGRKPSGKVGALMRADKPLRAVEDSPLTAVADVAPETKPSSALPLYETMLSLSPWNVLLRQQAFMAQALSNMMRAQQQYARMLSS